MNPRYMAVQGLEAVLIIDTHSKSVVATFRSAESRRTTLDEVEVILRHANLGAFAEELRSADLSMDRDSPLSRVFS